MKIIALVPSLLLLEDSFGAEVAGVGVRFIILDD